MPQCTYDTEDDIDKESSTGEYRMLLGDEKYKELTEDELLKKVRQLVVKTRNKLVHRLKLGTMVQGGDEPITSFLTRLKLVARTGRFQVECTAT